jgi:DNA-binding IclR family transcriptional regulator
MPTDRSTRPDTKIIHSLDKGLEVLELVAEAGGVANLSELAHRLQWDKSTVFRLLTTLARRGYVDRDEDTKRYYLGFRLLHLEQKLFQSLDLPRVSRDVLHSLSRATGESAHLASLERRHAVVVAQVECPERVAANARIGFAEPVYCTAHGKALLGQLPEDTLRRLIAELELRACTPKTITSAEWLIKHVQQVRHNGYALDEEEHDAEVRSIAAPVRVPSARKVFSVGISGPSTRMIPSRMPALIEEVRKAAEALSQRFSVAAADRQAR